MLKVFETVDEAIKLYEQTKEDAKNYDLAKHPLVEAKIYEHEMLVEWLCDYQEQKSLINFLKHQREKGHWIFGSTNGNSWMKCSQCLVSQDGQTACFSFCPNCGASMEN